MSYSHQDFSYVDMHVHFFPPEVFQAIWRFFEMRDEGRKVRGWPIQYKLDTEGLVRFLKEKKVQHYTTYNYAHKKGIASHINDWTVEFVKNHENAIPFGCVWPDDEDKVKYVGKLFKRHDFKGIKIQPLVQEFYLHDERMDPVYELIVEEGRWLAVHAGTAPYKNKYLGFEHFKKFIEKYPDMNVIVAHMGAFEYEEFFGLLDRHENLYLDTAMVFIPDNVFPERRTKQPSKERLISHGDRLLFGSDFPNIPYEYERSTKGLLNMELPKTFLEKIFFENAKRIMDL